MKPIKSILIVVALLLIVATVQGQSTRRLRVLIDASKCGGLWWFPQGRTFDPKQPHQGKPLADLIRAKGWEVVEVPGGEVITADTLHDADLVIRPPAYFNYSAGEVAAYR